MYTELTPPAATTAPALPVLIVGGSLVGLSMALFLTARGVPSLLVERHTESSAHPRAVGYTQRTLELFASAGLRGIPETPASFRLRRMRVHSLAGAWHDERAWTPGADGPAPEAPAPSPHTGAAIAQDRLEPMLRAQVRAATGPGATLELGTTLLRCTQDADGVTAWLRDRSGAAREVRAAYLVACDGGRSPIRETLGIGRKGLGVLSVVRSVLFRADLEHLQRGVGQFEIRQPGLEAFLTTYGDGRWVLLFQDDRERDAEELNAAISAAIGAPIPFHILTTGRWELTALIAERFSEGRIFLAGDAAHTLPPTRGGYGANTGIADAANLAWKLSEVLAGHATPDLLASYDEERRPIAWLRLRQTFARPDYAAYADVECRATPILDPMAIELGEILRSRILPDATPDLPDALAPSDWHGQPGTRAPHRWVDVDGASVSTLEWYGRRWVLVTASDAWEEVARAQDRALVVVRLASLSTSDAAAVADDLGIGLAGVTLVRPDGIIAWKSGEGPDGKRPLPAILAAVGCTSVA